LSEQLQVQYDTAAVNLYVVIRDSSGQAYRADTQVFEAYSTANLTATKYAIAMTEQGTASRYYTVAFPTAIVTAGSYSITVFQRAGGSPAETDSPLTGGTVDWDGAAIITQANVSKLLGTAWLTPGVAGTPDVNMKNAGGTAVTLDANNVLNVSTKYWAGTAITATSIPVATTAGASGGLLISGSNTGTTTLGALTITGATNLTGAVSATNAGNDIRGTSLTAAGIQAIWDAATSALITAGSIGKRLLDVFSGITSLASWLGAIAGKTADSSTQTEIRATTAGASYTITTDSLEAIRDRGDASWITATGFSTHTAADVWAVGTRALTDKAGFAISGTITTLDALNTSLSSVHGSGSWATATGFAVAGDAMTLTSGERNSVADAVLTRDASNVDTTPNEHSLYYVIMASSEFDATDPSNFIVYRTDGTTVFVTKTQTKITADEPIRKLE